MKVSKGFTLIELMIVIAIVAILAAIAMPAYKGYIQKSKATELVTVIEKEEAKVGVAFAENGSADNTTGALTLTNYDTSVKSVGTKNVKTLVTTSAGVITATGNGDLDNLTVVATPKAVGDDKDIIQWELSGTAVDKGLVQGNAVAKTNP